jgi:hypothetical protein
MDCVDWGGKEVLMGWISFDFGQVEIADLS